VQHFVNTNDREGRRDRVATRADLKAWCAGAGLGDFAPTAAEHRRALAFREALRSILLANNGAPLDKDAVALFNDVSQRAQLVVRVEGPSNAALRSEARRVDAVLGRLIAIVYDAMADGTWHRLKACRRDVCQWAFYDRSKNRSSTWCAMDVCGNRVKTTRYWRRRQAKRSGRR
jgi:predicted RNA-binding Zn ribbon-like protein